MKHLTHLFAAGVILTIATSPAWALANSSAYSDLDLDACETLEHFEEGISLKCSGYQDYPVYFKEGDLRQSAIYGNADPLLLKDSFESFGPFNHVNTKIEWRINDAGTPLAAIHRWFIENTNPDTGEQDKASEGQVLVISRVARQDDKAGCVVGYVDALANENANELARKVADEEAVNFACGYNEPLWWGEREDKSGEPMRYIPDEFKIE